MIQMHDFIGPIPLIGLNQFKNLNLQIIIYIAKFIDPVNQSFQLVNQLDMTHMTLDSRSWRN